MLEKQYVAKSIRLTESYAVFKEHPTDEKLAFFSALNRWSHFLTLSYNRAKDDRVPSSAEVLKSSRLFLSRLNRRVYGRHGVRRHGFRIGSFAVLGWGAYGDHPHTHWLLAKPTQIEEQEFTHLIHVMASTTHGIGVELDLQPYFSSRVIEYMLGHGFDCWVDQVTFEAKCPLH